MAASLLPLQLLCVSLAGWLSCRQQDMIDYLIEENRVLRNSSMVKDSAYPIVSVADSPMVCAILLIRMVLPRPPRVADPPRGHQAHHLLEVLIPRATHDVGAHQRGKVVAPETDWWS